ncbi:YfhO family protein [Butyrivibrio sp. AE3006]|uniref:YfhO family protein n=1 Tax=Butyrivibrio sp. AE3006 TaxID=1280673 RepID=UPI00042053F4|nr:YfhO family protein [Butyrivibrio sp. AE3006]
MNKRNDFSKGAMTGCVAALLTAALFMAICMIERIAPFGDKTFLYLDMKQQYVDFYSYYKAVFHGQDGFLWSENCGLGSSMTGIWTYYLTSPFLIPFIFISEKMIPTAVTLLICAKMVVAAFSMGVLMNYLSKTVEESSFDEGAAGTVLKAVFGTAYAFSGWMVSNMTNTMWVDVAAILPLVFMLYLKLLRNEKRVKVLYVISAMVMIFLNYYIAFMMALFFVIFTILLLVFRFIDGKSFLRVALYSLLSVILDLWFLIPVVLTLRGSNKDHSKGLSAAFQNILPSSEAAGKNISPLSVVSKLFSMSYDSIEIMDGLPNIYVGTAVFVVVILFFLNIRIDFRKKMAAFTFMLITMAFFCADTLNKLAHFGTDAYGYLYRYSVIFSFFCLILGFVCLCNGDGITIGGAIISGAMAEILLIASYVLPVRFITAKVLVINTAIIISISGSIILSVVCKGKAALRRCLVVFSLAVLAAELSLNFIWIYRHQSVNATSRGDYLSQIEGIRSALDVIDEHEKTGADSRNDDYRIETYAGRTANDGIHFGYNSVSTYNSLLKVEDRVLLYKLGFNDNGLYTEYTKGNTRLADELLGIKYIITDGSTEAGEGQQLIAQNVLMNEKVLSSDKYIEEKNVKECIKYVETASDSDNPFEVQKILYEKLTGNVCENFAEADVVSAKSKDGVSLDITAKEDGALYFYMARDKVTERSLELYLDGEFLSGYGNASSQKVICLGYFMSGDSCKLEIKTDAMGDIPAAPVVVTELYSH